MSRTESRHINVYVLWIAVLTEGYDLHLRIDNTTWRCDAGWTYVKLASLKCLTWLFENE